MRDSIGGVVNIMTIAIFMLIVSGYLAFSVSYNKAFRVKNKIITILEQHGSFSKDAEAEINSYIKQFGYNAYNPQLDKDDKCYDCKDGYCISWVNTTSMAAGDINDTKTGYFKVTTAVSIDVPIINKILPFLKILRVSGDTITLYEDNNDNFKNCR